MKYNLEGKNFHSIENTENGEVNSDTLFHYHQSGEIISAGVTVAACKHKQASLQTDCK